MDTLKFLNQRLSCLPNLLLQSGQKERYLTFKVINNGFRLTGPMTRPHPKELYVRFRRSLFPLSSSPK